MWWIQTARATQAGFTRRNVAHAAEELQCTFLALTDAVRFQTQSRLWRRLLAIVQAEGTKQASCLLTVNRHEGSERPCHAMLLASGMAISGVQLPNDVVLIGWTCHVYLNRQRTALVKLGVYRARVVCSQPRLRPARHSPDAARHAHQRKAHTR